MKVAARNFYQTRVIAPWNESALQGVAQLHSAMVQKKIHGPKTVNFEDILAAILVLEAFQKLYHQLDLAGESTQVRSRQGIEGAFWRLDELRPEGPCHWNLQRYVSLHNIKLNLWEAPKLDSLQIKGLFNVSFGTGG